MPCNGGNYFGRVEYRTPPEMRKKIDWLTRMLCHACGLLEDAEVDMGRELSEWHYEHKLADEERIKEAKARAVAESARRRRDKYLASIKARMLRQMTDDEREALGLCGGDDA